MTSRTTSLHSLLLCLGLMWTANAAAQEADPAAAADPAAEAAPAEAAADVAPEAAPADAPAEASAEPADPLKLYAGVDYVKLNLLLSDTSLQQRFGAETLDSNMLRLRAGVRVFDFIGLEAQYGTGGDGDKADEFEAGTYYGLFFVPTGVLFDAIEVAGVLGYTRMKAEHGNASETLSGAAFGVNIEWPLRLLSESMPDIRLGLGHITYTSTGRHRSDGLHAGLRYDFQL